MRKTCNSIVRRNAILLGFLLTLFSQVYSQPYWYVPVLDSGSNHPTHLWRINLSTGGWEPFLQQDLGWISQVKASDNQTILFVNLQYNGRLEVINVSDTSSPREILMQVGNILQIIDNPAGNNVGISYESDTSD